ncbi:sensor histidine kinase [Leptobacterium flavescens]|uniref:Sensor histidine kinase n=1 Tax=Leptobacterium flavescens TaxID=472055 RepID=A0A6P0ULR6_9FLAO|nr:sensor histidine kinase [Leptobacterium flavescens]NER13472.1 sensor histidine kinase [Leptobacterium flavescens]
MNKINRQVLIHFLIWLAIILMAVLDATLEDDESPVLFLIRIGVGIIIFYINYLILIPKLFFRKRIALYILSVFALIYTGGTIIYEVELLEHFDGLHDDPNHEHHNSKAIGFLVYTIFMVLGTITRTYNKLNKNELDKREIESQKNASELEALKNQINPHFLFNSLNSICSLAVKKSDETPEAIIMLSGLMRYMLYEATDELVLLEKEIAYIENYVNLQKLRLANKDSVSLTVSGAVNSQKIPPLLLISFIENAFKYGVDISGDTNVTITINVNKNTVRFYCLNRISKKQQNDENSGIGLQNTKKRLQMLYPDNHKLSIAEENGNFIVNLSLKLD